MKRTTLWVAFTAALLVGCGGGGGGSQAVPTANAATGTKATPTVVARGTLSIKFTPTLHAKAPKHAASTARKPAYVNGAGSCAGTSGACYLDVWVVDPVAQTATQFMNSSGSGGNLPSGSGTQTLSIPLYSGDANDIVAIEYDADPESKNPLPDILSIGEADYGAFTVGSAPAISLIMNMSVQYIGAMSDPNNNNGDAALFYIGNPGAVQNYNVYSPCCSNPWAIYFFAADATWAFATQNSGAGGIGSVTPVKSSGDGNDGDTLLSDAQSTGVNAVGYQISVPGAEECSPTGLSVVLNGLNPAGLIFNEAENAQSQGNFPASDYLYNNSLVTYPTYFLNSGGSPVLESATVPLTSLDVSVPGSAC